MRSKVWLTLLLALLAPVRICLAHPMGNFSVNHYAKITLEPDGVRLQYFIDLAEIPTYQELQQASLTPADTQAAAGDSPALSSFVASKGAELARGLSMRLDGAVVMLHLVSKAVIFPPGAGGLPTMKLGYVFTAAYPHGAGAAQANLAYTDSNYPGHAGWKEVIVTGPAAIILASSAPATDRSRELSNYPTDMLTSPPQDLAATVRITLPAALAASAVPPDGDAGRRAAALFGALTHPQPVHLGGATHAGRAPQRQLQGMTSRQSLQPQPVARERARPAAVPASTVATPAAEPVHLEANRQQTSRSAFTQLITAQHLSLWFLLTAAVISIGLGALHALEPGHGKTIVAAYLVGSRGTGLHAVLLGLIVTASHTASVFALGAVTLYASRYILPEQLYPWLGVLSGLTIALLGGYLFLRRLSGQEVEHSHVSGEQHGHWFARKQTTSSPTMAASTASARPVSLGQLFALGITGGIIPCPAALVVLLSAFSLHRVGFGFFLITAFSAGLAAVLIGFGLAMVYGRRWITRLAARFQHRFPAGAAGTLTRRWLPAGSAAIMTVLGIVIAARAWATTGLTLHSLSPQRLGPALFVAGLGLVLGMRHSTDTDHVVAISTIVTRERSIRGAALIGSLWGLGHTLTIFVVGCLIILFGVVIPPRVGLSMEFSVALMLILLGLLNLTGMMQRLVARFRPAATAGAASGLSLLGVEVRSTGSRPLLNSFTVSQYLRPLAIGLVHGLAGSAAVALLVLSTIHSPVWAILYLVIFGGGTMFGMMCMTATMALPLVYAGDRLPRMGHYLGIASGLVSVCFGSFLVYQLGFLGGLFTSHPHWTPQ